MKAYLFIYIYVLYKFVKYINIKFYYKKSLFYKIHLFISSIKLIIKLVESINREFLGILKSLNLLIISFNYHNNINNNNDNISNNDNNKII